MSILMSNVNVHICRFLGSVRLFQADGPTSNDKNPDTYVLRWYVQQISLNGTDMSLAG